MNNNKNNKAFSLIELSVILIIIGLLISGITGGASLIENAQNRALVNEIREWKQSINIFYTLKERLPGDLNIDGKIGYNSGEIYNKNSFPYPYNGEDKNYPTPDIFSAPFIDLYLAKITKFKPIKTNKQFNVSYFYSTLGGTKIPILKNLKNYVIHFEYKISDSSYWLRDIREQQLIGIRSDLNKRSLQTTKSFWYIDRKIDDGLFNLGSIRSSCWTNNNTLNYDQLIKKNEKCFLMFIKI